MAILKKVGEHRNIVALRDVFETQDEWFLVMELVTGGELFERLVRQGPYSEKEASRLMRQMAEAISYLHSQGVCHRDLKPENILLSEQPAAPAGGRLRHDSHNHITVKICDFGLSVALDGNGSIDEKQGTWAYWAPEMFSNIGYGKQVDMWSLGIILLCGARSRPLDLWVVCCLSLFPCLCRPLLTDPEVTGSRPSCCSSASAGGRTRTLCALPRRC